jgi:hypothetical protein
MIYVASFGPASPPPTDQLVRRAVQRRLFDTALLRRSGWNIVFLRCFQSNIIRSDAVRPSIHLIVDEEGRQGIACNWESTCKISKLDFQTVPIHSLVFSLIFRVGRVRYSKSAKPLVSDGLVYPFLYILHRFFYNFSFY